MMDVEKRIYQLATDLFDFNYKNYTKVTGRELLGVKINPEKGKFEHLFGDFPDNFLLTINKQFHDTIAGYRVDVGAYFPELNIKADVFLININNLAEGENDIDSLLIHELCHMVLDSNSLNDTSINICEKDKFHGNKLFKKTDSENVRVTKHTEEFCNLLSAVSDKVPIKMNVFNDRWDCINSAMRYDLKGCLRQ